MHNTALTIIGKKLHQKPQPPIFSTENKISLPLPYFRVQSLEIQSSVALEGPRVSWCSTTADAFVPVPWHT